MATHATIKPMKFTLPKHTKQVQGLGYAFGLNDGIFNGMLPVVPYGPTITNNPEQFQQIFDEWFKQGYTFGEHCRQKLWRVLNTIPQQWWWAICIAFAGQHLGLDKKEQEELSNLDRHIEQGMREFERIYQESLP